MLVAILASVWLYAVLGLVVGFLISASGMFDGPEGIVLAGGSVVVIVVAAVLGALSPVLPGIVGAVAGRIALFCVCLVASIYTTEHFRKR